MITVHESRISGGQEREIGSLDLSLDESLSKLIDDELSFGGEITEVSLNRVTVKTAIGDIVDVTSFQGSSDEMIQLVKVAQLYMQAIQSDEETFRKTAKEIEGTMLSAFPGLLKSVASMLVGKNRMKLALVLAEQELIGS